MNKWQADVLEFHRRFGLPDGTGPFNTPTLRASLILEESIETVVKGLGCDLYVEDLVTGLRIPVTIENLVIDQSRPVDEIELADGLADAVYVQMGTAVEAGIDMDPVFAEVHRSNMEKEGGSRRLDGKVLKPEGWKPPDIAGVLESQRKPVEA